MACGTPVIVSNAASMPEIVGDAGVYFNPFDPEDIAKAILLVLTEKDLQQQQMRVKGLARARLFSWKKAAERLLEIFDKAAENGEMIKE
jgi:glycosyltransferase involved in cell wall biosynthesis